MTAATADPLKLYEASVQCTEATIDFIDDVFKNKSLAPPMRLREDFCGTARLCGDWVSSHPERTAVGLDIDAPTIDWARVHNIEPLGEAATRVELRNQDVLAITDGDFDVVAAFNFSYWVFQQRAVLKQYFEAVRTALRPGGDFVMDLHGGPDSQFILEEDTRYDGFTYVWDQESFDPINNRVVCHIHFKFPDRTKLEKAFTYDWRIWSLPELRDLLDEVGFNNVETWWDGEDDVIRPAISALNLESWIAYLVAWR